MTPDTDGTEPVELCHCGLPLHYPDPLTKALVEGLIARVGEYVTVTHEGRSWRVPRHYIALHGINPAGLRLSGFEEVDGTV